MPLRLSIICRWQPSTISLGVNIILVLSSGVYHLEHEARSGSKTKKRNEKMQNELIYAKLLDRHVSDLNPTYIYS